MLLMNPSDVLGLLLILGFIIITACVVSITFYLIQALRSITNLADNLEGTTQSIKDKIQLKVLAAIPALLINLVGKVIKKRRG